MDRSTHFSIRCLISLSLFGGAFACNVEPIEDEGATLPEEVQMAFDRSCAFSGCHVSGGQSPFLDAGSSATIVGGRSQQDSDLKLVVPGDVEKSYLALKMLAPDMLPPGASIQSSPMPLGAKSEENEADITVIIDWIKAGAMVEDGY